MEIRVCTFNVKNHFKVCPSWSYTLDNVKFNKIIETEGLDMVGLQEMTKPRNKSLKKQLNNKTLVEGKGRYLGLVPFVDEYNSLIINNDKFKVVSSKTYYLPWLQDVKNQISSGALMPRIATVTNLKTLDGRDVCAIVTHLDYHSLQVQEEQLKELTKILSTIYAPMILMGDFNMFPSHPIFKKYKKLWEEMFGLEEAELIKEDKRTWIGNKDHYPKENGPYDYIFATPEFILEHTDTIDYREELDTDHLGRTAQFKF